METNSGAKTGCRRCGGPLGPTLSRRLCARCLFGAAVNTAPHLSPENSQETSDTGSPPVAKSSPNLPASRVGNYELMEELGHGGMGIVYKARQVGLDRLVAVKMLLYGRWTNERFVERFRVEARAAAALDHPGIVGIHEVGEQDGQPWFSMDLLPGPSLADLVRDRPLPPRRAAALLKSVAESVAHAHQRGVLHRDLKPANVLLDEDGHPRVTDFGLAKDSRTEGDMTLSGETLGSPHYLPPEQIGGRPDAAAPAADIYSLGAILYHLLTGRPPFQSDALEATLLQVMQQEPAPPRLLNPAVPLDLQTVCLKCLEKEPERRYPTARDLAEDLGRFLSDQPVQARAVTPLQRTWRWCRRHPSLASLLVVSGLLLLTILIGSPIAALRIQRERDAAAAEADRARRSEYASDMLIAQQAFTENHLRRVDQLLTKHDPTVGLTKKERAGRQLATPDLRGWEWYYLREQARGDATAGLATNLQGFIALSPDGMTLAVSVETNVLLLNASNGQLKARIPHSGKNCLGIAFNRQGEFVFQESTGHLRGWSLNPLREVGVLTNDTTPGIVRFSPDGRWLATAGYEQGIDLWDWPARRLVYRVEERSGWSYSRGFAFSPDGQFLAWANRAGEVIFWNLSEAREVRRVSALPGWDAPVCWLEFTPDGKYLACSGVDRSLRLFEVATWSERRMYRNPSGLARIVTFLPDNKTLLVLDDDYSIQVWDWPQWQLQRVLRGHRDQASSVAVAPGGRRFFTGCWDGKIRSWDSELDPLASRRIAFNHSTRATAIAMDGAVLLQIDTNSVATILSTTTLKEYFRGSLPGVLKTNSISWAIASGGQRLARLDANRQVQLWRPGDAEAGAPLAGSPADEIAFSPDGKQLMGASHDRHLQLWNVETGSRVAHTQFEAHTNDLVWCVTVSPDGFRAAVGLMHGSLLLWDTRKPGPPNVLRPATNAGGVLGLRFSDDGRRLAAATGGADGVWLYDVERQHELGHLDALTQATRRVAFSPDGQRLAVGGADGTLTLWEPESGQQLLRLPGHPDRIDGIKFLPDGKNIVSLSDTELRIWRAGEK